jgi:hypothetical protein
MGVALEKWTDADAPDVRDVYERTMDRAGLNRGTAPVEFIGGHPTGRERPARTLRPVQHVTGGRVRVCGLRIKTRQVAFLDVNGPGGTAWIMGDGARVPADEYRSAGDWFRFLLDSGSFAGVEFLR